jgi:hypothetical protein
LWSVRDAGKAETAAPAQNAIPAAATVPSAPAGPPPARRAETVKAPPPSAQPKALVSPTAPGGYQEMADRLQGTWLLEGYPGGPVECEYRKDGVFTLSAERDGRKVTTTGKWRVAVASMDTVHIYRTIQSAAGELFDPDVDERLAIKFEEDRIVCQHKGRSIRGERTSQDAK